MNYLGIDYGRKKIGLSIADSDIRLANPLAVIRITDQSEGLKEIKRVIENENIDEIVVGISDGEMGKESEKFGRLIETRIGKHVSYVDETLTSHDAQELSKELGHSSKKRRSQEDAYSAAMILQIYLDRSETV